MLLHQETKEIENIPIVSKFVDVFLEDLLVFPPKRELEFTIVMKLGTAPIARMPYQMSASKLQDLKMQLNKFLDLGLIHPTVSSWGEPMIFVRKKDGS
jgi:hypothetical protein